VAEAEVLLLVVVEQVDLELVQVFQYLLVLIP
jgi:hypothetical protein